MTIFERVQKLGLPKGGYAVVGGGVLEAHGLREAGDVDLVVSDEVYALLVDNGWQKKKGIDGVGIKLYLNEVEAFSHIKIGTYQPNTVDLLARAELIQNVPFLTLVDTRAYKLALGREKDLHDIELIDAALQRVNQK